MSFYFFYTLTLLPFHSELSFMCRDDDVIVIKLSDGTRE